jgi:hypothetical protein
MKTAITLAATPNHVAAPATQGFSRTERFTISSA